MDDSVLCAFHVYIFVCIDRVIWLWSVSISLSPSLSLSLCLSKRFMG